MNTPRINPDDPKWTAYVLGELDETERIEIERLLEASGEARALVEELSVAAMTLKDELAPMTSLMMSPEQRAVIESAMQPAPKRWFEMFPSKWGWGLAAAAAGLVLVLVLPTMKPGYRSVVQNEAKVAQTTPPSLPEVSTPAAKTPVGTSAQASARLESDYPTVTSTAPTAEAPRPTAAPVSVAPVLSQAEVATLLQGNAGAVTGGEVTGTVVDSSKAFIPGVTVKAVNTNNGIVNTTVTNEAGVYDLSPLTPGTYRITASLPGFQTRTVTDLEVRSAERLRQDFPLAISGINTQVEVSAAADQIRTTAGATVGQVLPQQRIADLPLVGNNALELTKIMPAPAAAPPPPPPSPARSASGLPAGAGAAGGGRGGGAARGGAAAAPAAGAATAAGARQVGIGGPAINPDIISEIRLQLAPVDGELTRASGRAASPPPPPPSPAYPVNRPNGFGPNTESYDRIVDNPFIRTAQENLATFSIDVDTASYANMRRFLTQNQMPPRDSVRIEELLNYFNYDYAQPRGSAPIEPNMEVAATPWNPQSRLVRIGIKAREINADRRPPSNLVFLIDVSGSMNQPAKLPLVKAGLKMMVDRLGENDSVSIVVYAGASGLVLRPTSAIRKEAINQAIDSLQPGGSTNGASGIRLAYDQAVANFIRGGTNRVILMTDGDFNVGVTNQGDLTRLIEERAKSGVFLSVLGFGMGNIKDSTLEKLADQGNGHYAYIDNINEARKVLVEEMGGTLVTVAKDVKIQVDFNPARVEAYRLIGYENRLLRTEDFNNDLKDAGDMGAGHTVTALFEVVPKGGYIPGPSIDPSKYTLAPANGEPARIPAGSSNEMLTLRVRYKLPEASTSTRMDVPLVDQSRTFARATQDFRFAASVAEFGMILRESPYRGTASMDSVLDIAEGSRGQDRNGYRQEFIELVQKARRLR